MVRYHIEKNTVQETLVIPLFGRLLEVPVGTGVLTMPLYASLPKSEITCLDYSADMMANAKKRAADGREVR